MSCDHGHMPLFFLYISNLLYRVHRQTMVATFITTYKRTKLHEVRKRKKGKEKKEKKKRKVKVKEKVKTSEIV